MAKTIKDPMLNLCINYKQRCSSLGKIILPDGGLTEAQQKKYDGFTIKEKLTELQQADFNELKAKLVAKPELTTGAKTYLNEVYDELELGFRRNITSKYMENGTDTEPDGLQLLSETLAPNIISIPDEEFYENEWLKGTPDKVDIGGALADIWDNKSAYYKETLSKAEFTPVYKWQGRGYMFLLQSKGIQAKKFGLFYSLNDHSDRQIKRECDAEFYQNPNKYLTMEDPKFKEFCERHEKKVKYSEYLDNYKRFRVWFDVWDDSFKTKIIDSVKAAREYLVQVHNERLDEYNKNGLLMLEACETN